MNEMFFVNAEGTYAKGANSKVAAALRLQTSAMELLEAHRATTIKS
jgi:hypothetical protein